MRIELDDGWLDLDAGLVHRSGEPTALSTMERRLLAFLAEHLGEPVPQETLLEEVWGYGPTVETRTVRVTVGRIRKKIEVDPKKPRHLRGSARPARSSRPTRAPCWRGSPSSPARSAPTRSRP